MANLKAEALRQLVVLVVHPRETDVLLPLLWLVPVLWMVLWLVPVLLLVLWLVPVLLLVLWLVCCCGWCCC